MPKRYLRPGFGFPTVHKKH